MTNDPNGTDEHASVLASIHSAFAGVGLQGGVSLTQAALIDRGHALPGNQQPGDQRLSQSAAPAENGLSWQDITADEIRQKPFLCHMDAQGFLFHLPAFMCFCLKHYRTSDSNSINATLYSLWPQKGALWDYHMLHYSLLNKAQRKAVVGFLDYFASDGMEAFVDQHSAREALLSYWAQFA